MSRGRKPKMAYGQGRSNAGVGRNREEHINIVLAQILDREPEWKAIPERTRVVRGQLSRRPDIVVDVGGRAIVIETEFPPASGLHYDMTKAASYDLRSLGRPIATVGIVLPRSTMQCRAGEIEENLMGCNSLEYYVVSSDGTRFPPAGHLTGSVLDVRTAIRLSSVPEADIRNGYEMMADGVDKIEHIIRERVGDATHDSICEFLRQQPGDGTWRMAALVLLNACMFYDELSGHRNDVKATQSLSVVGIVDHATLLGAWRAVRAIDYAPIFDTAIAVLGVIPPAAANDIITIMISTSSQVMATGANRFVDFYGMLYQRLLYERKLVAAYYTRPEAATLLAGLTISGCEDDVWRDRDRIRRLRIADFACGSGSLLHAAYSHIIHCSHITLSDLHSYMMENCIWAADIFPVATHFAVSALSSMFPSKTFDDCHIYTRKLGPGDAGGYHLGSLDLIDDLEPFVNAGVMYSGQGPRPVRDATLQHGSCDYIVMNPPFARATNHGGDRPDPVPPFAIRGINPQTQIRMGRHNSHIFKGTCAHGHAGLASHFLAICNKKIKKDGGRFGLILPDGITTGQSWLAARNMLAEWYDDLTVTTVGHGDDGTYSSDTTMHEVMLVAQKRSKKRTTGDPAPRIKFVQLDRMPSSRMEALAMSKTIRDTKVVKLEDDVGVTSLIVGDANTIVGRAVSCPVEPNMPWVCRRVRNIDLLQFVYSLAQGKLSTFDDARNIKLENKAPAHTIPIRLLGSFADMGRHHLDIIGTKKDGTPQGPFNKLPRLSKSKYACLWNNNADTQQNLLVKHDCSLEAKHDATRKHVASIWSTSSRVHLNNQVRYGSQRLIAAYTEDRVLGGRTWPNVVGLDEKYEKAFTTWCNTTFGLLLYWLVAGSQHRGRGQMGVDSFRKTFYTLDVRQLNVEQLARFDTLFDTTCRMDLKPLSNPTNDRTRKRIDEEVMRILYLNVDLSKLYGWIENEPQITDEDPLI